MVLGLRANATEDEVRRRYLELVKQFPPEKDPERFREIHQAYELAKDPLVLAMKTVASFLVDPVPLLEIVEKQRGKPPRLPTQFLLGLGNKEKRRTESNAIESQPAQ